MGCWAHARRKFDEAVGKALHYLKEQEPYLVRCLEDGRLEISNNRAERSIKPFVMGRKNWLIANTPMGAQASAVIYSLMETAKETELDPYKYLLWVLREAPMLFETNQEWAKKLTLAHCTQHCVKSLLDNCPETFFVFPMDFYILEIHFLPWNSLSSYAESMERG